MSPAARTRRPNGEGSVGSKILKDGSRSWWARCPIDPKRPLERGEYKGGFKTQREAVDWKRKRTTDIMAGKGANNKNLTVPQIVEMWLDEASENKRESTMIHYRSNFNCTIKPLLNIQVRNLDPLRMQKFILQAAATSKRGNGRAWARTAFNNVRAAMRWAYQHDIIRANPIEGVKFEFQHREKVRRAIPIGDYHAILDACEGQQSQLIWRVLVATGARRGEITGLNVGDVDFRNGTINSDKIATVESHGRLVKPGNKTGEDALIRLTPALLAELRVHVGDRPASDPLFLGPQNKTRLAFGTLGRWWKRDLKAAGLDGKYVIHQLRHTFATVALDNGADLKVVSSMLRHRSVVTTMNIYRDVNASSVDATNDLVESALSRPITTLITTLSTTTPSADES